MIYKLGSWGEDVRGIQSALKAAGVSLPEPNGIFDEKTEAAVKEFQNKVNLKPDGVVGAQTMGKLGLSLPKTRVASGTLASRCLALTGSFETGTGAPECFAIAAGNFDGQGMSFGALQWNFGQITLQPLLQEMIGKHRQIMDSIFGADLGALQKAMTGGREACLAFASTIQDDKKHVINDRWKQMFRTLGLTAEFQAIEVAGATKYYEKAVKYCQDYGLWSERARALMFDVSVQNGNIFEKERNQILEDYSKLPPSLSAEELEVRKMQIVANRRAEASRSQFVEDVRRRKLCIAEGKGIVHGIAYDLAKQYNLDLRKAD